MKLDMYLFGLGGPLPKPPKDKVRTVILEREGVDAGEGVDAQKTKGSSRVPSERPALIAKRRDQIVETLRNNGPHNASELSKALGWCVSVMCKDLEFLREQGRVDFKFTRRPHRVWWARPEK